LNFKVLAVLASRDCAFIGVRVSTEQEFFVNIFVKATAPLLITGCALAATGADRANATPPSSPLWQSAARLHRTIKRPLPGTFVIDSEGVEFRSAKFSGRWSFLDIHTFDLSGRDFTVITYGSRRWHEPGDQRFHFTLAEAIPPSVAAIVQDRVARPARDGAPDPAAPAIAEIPARHGASSNGMLRVRNSGIDYVSENGHDSRSWRWQDIQTIANSDPYSFRVTAYREIAEFQLKRPLPRELFDEMWDKLYASDLNLSTRKGGEHL
jgi:hypothetical protein